jgi:peptide/nickel transport system ATP-binding protein
LFIKSKIKIMIKVNIPEISITKDLITRELLRNICFKLEPGNIYSITGKNGTGKSTLLKSLTPLLDKRFFDVKGEVMFKGTNLLSLTEDHLIPVRKKYIKYVFQDPQSSFNPLKKFNYYFENMEIDKSSLSVYMEKLLLPSYDEIKNLHPYEVSGGMAQRLSIAIALAANPVLLLLDEPNSGIDYAISNIISDILREFTSAGNSIVLIVTQDFSFAESVSDYIGVLYKKTFSGFFHKKDIFNQTGHDDELAGFLAAYKSI